ncbi:MAG TPA: F0F1 ATP synthase subunit A [Jatrophihabitans sp.]|uniref:F0F1 ATP synthase subunit A n=1 Tax=Jatrophihabitans sp. TaxID=1932789 RepID=UPI002DF996BD|nr:F0F1 ATP synthase subunit A [Jatrophihabitans sp.]
MSAQNLAINITPGEHIEWHVAGLTLNGDTITATLIAGAIILLIGFLIQRKSSTRRPTKLQLAFETITEQVERQVEDTMGIKTAPFVVPLAMTLFVFILIANLIAIVPTGHHPEYAPPPASDVNLTYALAILVIGTMHVVGIRKRGVRGFYGHLFEKPRVMIPLRLVEEVMKPVTLALRLFGNIFAGTIMVALIAAMPAAILWLPDILWKLFDAFIGLIQAFIFALLTVLYMSSIAPHEEGAHH